MKPKRLSLLLFGAILLAAGFVRYLAALGDLWFDEVWTWYLVKSLTSPVQVLTGMHHDNNHYLNSLWFYWIGDSRSFAAYRVPSLVMGTGAIAVATLIAWRRGRAEALLAALLFGGSFLLILYSSEARGYSGGTFFALTSFYAMQRYLDRRAPGRLALFWASSALGFLGHLSYLLVAGSLGLWTLILFIRRERAGAKWIWSSVCCHGPPLAFLLWLYWVDVRHVHFGDVVYIDFGGVLLETLSLAMRLPLGWLPMRWLGVVVLLAFVAWVASMQRRADDEWWFYAIVFVSGPLFYGASLIIVGPQPIAVRYFLVCFVFLQLGVAFLLADLARRGRPGATCVALLVAAIMVGNSQLTAQLLEHGRGSYLRALEDMAARTQEDRVSVASDHDLQNGYLVLFYSQFIDDGRSIAYVTQQNRRRADPKWFIVHSFDRLHQPDEQVKVAGRSYRLAESYPAAPYSGFPWFVYHREDADRK